MRLFHKLKKKLKPGYIENDLTSFYPLLQSIRKKENDLKSLSDQMLQDVSAQLISRAAHQDNDLLTDAYALVSEVAFRTLKTRPFDVQILAAIALHQGSVVEMQTGEGKTLTATLPVYLNAILNKNVHILTFNDYLAQRDAGWMQPVYNFLGLKVGFIQESMTPQERKAVYLNHIVYVTAKEAGFDYLRDQLATSLQETIRPETSFAIIDEVDSILIDEARIPLVIAGEVPSQQVISFYQTAELVKALLPGIDFQTDTYQLNIFLTEQGIEKVENQLGSSDLYAPENEELLVKTNLSLQAENLLHRDMDYIVRNGNIELIDEFTGRVAENRKWPYGLQSAIEAKENLTLQPEGKVLGKTTLQHFINTYSKISGMTGTAQPAAEEFADLYGVPVLVIPPNRLNCRVDHPDHIFYTKEARLIALIKEIKKVNATGRPILMGTATIEESELIAVRLLAAGIRCQVLNAKNDAEEAGIVARAGMFGSVTIATNMAGRGTDIKLGGKAGVWRDKILALGGLYVIGTNRFESRRIDDQLRGRAGRQGDPGDSQFFISLQDDLLVKHGIEELIPKRLRQNKSTDLSPVSHQVIRREVNRAQRIVEGKNFDIRKTLSKYTSFIEMQRKIVHQRRQQVLEGDYDSLLAEQDQRFYHELTGKFGQPLIQQVETQITLAVIDKHWANYLEKTDQIRQSIYLMALGGLHPFYEFQKTTNQLFSELLELIDQEVIQKLKTVRITQKGIDLEEEGLKAPTSTWTYLISDNPFGDRLEIMLGSNSNIGFSAFAALVWPLLAFYYLVKRLVKRKNG